MKQTNLFEEEQYILGELNDFNYKNSAIICDIVIADKLKRGLVDGEII